MSGPSTCTVKETAQHCENRTNKERRDEEVLDWVILVEEQVQV